MRQVLVYRGEDGLWVAECPSLPGCVSQGETQESAIDNIREAIAAYVGALDAIIFPSPKSALTHALLRCEPSSGDLVAHALVRAASALLPTPARRRRCRDESRHGTQECVRHKHGPTFLIHVHRRASAA